MRIVNPIYDTGFKLLMEDPAIARQLIGAITGLHILEISFSSQERVLGAENEKPRLFRLDFVALVKTESGNRQVTIEVQKSQRVSNIAHFRKYIGSQYQSAASADPLMALYFLGYDLPGLNDTVIAVERSAKGLISGQTFPHSDPHIDFLSHDMYLLQVKRLAYPSRTPLEGLLQVFNQKYKMDSKQYLLEIPEEELSPDAQRLARRLELLVADLSEKSQLELEAQAELEYQIDFGKMKEQAEAASRREAEALKRVELERAQKEAIAAQNAHLLKSNIQLLHKAGHTPEAIAQKHNLPLEEVMVILDSEEV